MNTFIRKNHITFTSICIGIHSKASVLSNGYPYKRFLIKVNKRKCNSVGQMEHSVCLLSLAWPWLVICSCTWWSHSVDRCCRCRTCSPRSVQSDSWSTQISTRSRLVHRPPPSWRGSTSGWRRISRWPP